MLKPTSSVEEVAGHNVIKLGPEEGSKLWIGDWHLTWRAQGKDTGYGFSIFETTISPENGLPLHKHPFCEWFYVLEGNLDFARWDDSGNVEWIACDAGTSVLVPPNAPHAFHNRSNLPARFLSVSSYHHERMLKQGFNTGDGMPHSPIPMSKEEFERRFKGLEENQVYVVSDRSNS